MDIVVIVSPATAIDYACECTRNSLLRGEAPLASALIFDRVLKPDNDTEREAGMLAWSFAIARADCVAVYVDEGLTPETERLVAAAHKAGVRVVYRTRLIPNADMSVMHVSRYKHAWDVITGGKQ